MKKLSLFAFLFFVTLHGADQSDAARDSYTAPEEPLGQTYRVIPPIGTLAPIEERRQLKRWEIPILQRLRAMPLEEEPEAAAAPDRRRRSVSTPAVLTPRPPAGPRSTTARRPQRLQPIGQSTSPNSPDSAISSPGEGTSPIDELGKYTDRAELLLAIQMRFVRPALDSLERGNTETAYFYIKKCDEAIQAYLLNVIFGQ